MNLSFAAIIEETKEEMQSSHTSFLRARMSALYLSNERVPFSVKGHGQIQIKRG